MKAEELRIGNWLKRHDDSEFQVTADDIQIIANWNSIAPLPMAIPLTEGWLNEFGWHGYKDRYLNSYFSIDSVGHLFYHGDYTGTNIDHVHQLQNLYFALTGKELTKREDENI